MLTKIKKIIILGGGTSGWLTAAYLNNNLRLKPEIMLIEDLAKGPIGVGEGTQPYSAGFLYRCGLRPNDWIPSSEAVFKYGVELTGWNDTPYFVDNDRQENSIIADEFYTNDYFISKDKKEFFDWLPAYQLAKKNVSPKFKGLDQNFAIGEENYGAFHFNAAKIIDTLKTVCNGVIHVDTAITRIDKNENGITALYDDKNKYEADLYIDCTGFSSVLLEKELGEEFISYQDFLPCDSAVAMPTQYTDPNAECHPYTKATAMNAGWRWTIPVYTRIGNGYVYSSKYINHEQAEQELRDTLKEYNAPANHLKMKCGKHENVARNNVVAVGLSAGFIEPLEATGITFTTTVVENLAHVLNLEGNVLNNRAKEIINSQFNIMIDEIFAFVWAHYYFSNKEDTNFWKDIRKGSIYDLPQNIRQIINQYYPTPSKRFRLTPFSMFSTPQWFSVIHAAGSYKKQDISQELELYSKIFIENQNHRVNLIKTTFPNHYDYIKEINDANSV